MAVQAGSEQVRTRARVWVHPPKNAMPRRCATDTRLCRTGSSPSAPGGQPLSAPSAKSSDELPLNLQPRAPASPAPCTKLLLYSLVSSLSCYGGFYCVILAF